MMKVLNRNVLFFSLLWLISENASHIIKNKAVMDIIIT